MKNLFTCFFLCILAQSSWAAEYQENRSQKRLIHIAADYNYPPYEFSDKAGRPAGYHVDLSYAIAEVMGFDIDITMTDWESAYSGLQAGRYDILQGIAYSEDRSKHIIYSSPHSIVNQSLFARKDGPKINDINEVNNHSIIVQRASIMHEYLQQFVPRAIIVPVSTHSDALRLLASGKHDFALTANLPSLYLSRELGLSNIQPIAAPVAAQRLGYGALIHNEDIVALFSEGLAILNNTGRQQEIYNKWLGSIDGSKGQWKSLGLYATYTTLVLLLVLGVIMVWNTLLRKEVEKRSKQLKAHQEQLIQADKMASLGVLVSGVAHEINNPTGLLMLNMPILQSAWRDALPILEQEAANNPNFQLAGLPYQRIIGEIPFLLDEMQHSTDRIRNIVNDLKDFAREQPDETPLEVDINNAVVMAVRLVDKSIKNVTDHFKLTLDPNHPKIHGNPQRIEQVIINLILNACDALGSKDKALSVSTVLSLDKKSVVIAVEDQGCGIQADNLARLTDPFYTTKREIGGTGLGLSVSATIIKAHKGRLCFDSTPGQGTTATIYFPLHK